MNEYKVKKFIEYNKIRLNTTIKKRTGCRWNKLEIIQLKNEVGKNETYENIAIKHNRTEEAIRLQVIKSIIEPIVTKENKHEISEKYNIVLSGIEHYMNFDKHRI